MKRKIRDGEIAIGEPPERMGAIRRKILRATPTIRTLGYKGLWLRQFHASKGCGKMPSSWWRL